MQDRFCKNPKCNKQFLLNRKDKVFCTRKCKTIYFRITKPNIYKQYLKKHYIKNADKIIKRNKDYYLKHRDKTIKYLSQYYYDNFEYYQKARKEHYLDNFEHYKQYGKQYRKLNLKKCRAWNAKYKAKKLKATPKFANLQKIKEIYMNCPVGYHVDHIVPLQGKNVCGLHVEWNLQYLTPYDNLVKSNKLII
jgi:hypothetical protein